MKAYMLAAVVGAVVGLGSLGAWAQSGAQQGSAQQVSGQGAGKSAQQAAKGREAGSPTIEQFFKIRAPGSPQIAPTGEMYTRDWPQGINQVFRVKGDVARPDGEMEQLTFFEDGATGFSLAESGKWMVVTAARGGNENNQIYLIDPKSAAGEGAVKPAVINPKVQHSVNLWLHDDSGFIYTANDESPNDFYIYRFDIRPEGEKMGSATKILGKEGSWAAGDITRDGKRVLVGQYRSISDSSVHELDTATGELKDLSIPSKDAPTVSVGVVGYMPDEKSVLLEADAAEGIKRLYLRDLASGEVREPIAELRPYEIDQAAIDKDRTLLGVVTNEDGYGVLRVYTLPEFKKVELPAIERGVVGLTELKKDRVSWVLSNARTPGITYTAEIKNGKAGQARAITSADTQGVDLQRFPLPELIKFSSFDGLEVPAFLYLPPGHQKGRPIPFVVNYHGGPEGQFRPGFDRTVQYLVAQGYGVLQPNVRGSTGYGRAFHMMDDYKKRWDSVKDGVEAAEWLVENGYAQPGKIATYGGSYGGFMSVATLVEDSERVESGQRKERVFGAGINVVGIVNMKTFLEQTSGYRRKLREVEYGPLTDPEFLASVSSMNRIDKIQVPMMIAHGLNDPRVPVGEAMQLAVGLKKRGYQPVELYFPDEGHGFAKLENRLLFSKQMVKFLDESIGAGR